MGVLSEKIQSFVETLTNAITATESDVVEGKTFWKSGAIHPGILRPMDASAYRIEVLPDSEDIRIVFLQKTYTTPEDAIVIPKELVESILTASTN